jgi:sec-independent protein translocase protein TatA
MGSMSLSHWLIVAIVVLLVFGPSRLGQIGSGLGEGIKNFKKGLNDDGSAPPEKKTLKEGESSSGSGEA